MTCRAATVLVLLKRLTCAPSLVVARRLGNPIHRSLFNRASRKYSQRTLRRKFVPALFLIAVTLIMPAHAATINVGPNVDIIPSSDRQQAEPTIAIDPGNPRIIVAGAQDYNLQAGCCPPSGHRWNGYYRSTDGGTTWSRSFLPGFPGDTSPQGRASPLQAFDLTSDPVLAFDGAGNVYYTGLAIKLSSFSIVAYVAKYVDDGADYAGVALIGGAQPFADKPWVAVDTTGGPNDGNVYVAFDSPGTVFTRSTDHGRTFSKPIPVPAGGLFPGVVVDATGNVFVSTIHFSGKSGAQILVTKSTDGGFTFEKSVVVARIASIPSPLPGNFFRTGTIPQIAADDRGVYVVWDDFGTGDADVLFASSRDGGATWSSPLRVNDAATGQQFFPSISVAAGTISVVWYDSRQGQLSNGTITGLDVFYARSTDAGASFSKNLRLTSVSFNPNLVRAVDFNRNGPFMGDYIQVAAGPGVVHPVWTDNRNACDFIDPILGCLDQDTFTVTITF